jgi:hypothetical protein
MPATDHHQDDPQRRQTEKKPAAQPPAYQVLLQMRILRLRFNPMDVVPWPLSKFFNAQPGQLAQHSQLHEVRHFNGRTAHKGERAQILQLSQSTP